MDAVEYQDCLNYLTSAKERRIWPKWIEDIGDSKEKDQAKRNYRSFVSKFAVHMGTLVRAENSQIRVITAGEKLNVIRGCHDGIGGGHLGVNNTFDKVRTRFWWNGFSKDIKEYIKSCEKCQSGKPMAKRPSTLHPVAVPERIFKLLGMDLVGPMNLTARGNRYILVICDYTTKWPEAFAIPSKEAINVAEKVYEVICRYSVPDAIISDQGREFVNAIIDDLCKRLGTKRRISTAYHPQTNGLTERLNQSILMALRKYVNGKQNDWDEHLNSCLFAYRTAKQSSTKASPYELVYGCRPQLPIDLDFKDDIDDQIIPDDDQIAESLVKRMESFEQLTVKRDMAHKNISKAQQKQSQDYNKRHQPPTYVVGQMVSIENKRQKARKGDKLLPEFFPPVKILDVFDNGTVKVEGRKTLVNVAHIQPFFKRPQTQLKEKQNDENSDDDTQLISTEEVQFLQIPFLCVDISWQKERSATVGLIVQWPSYPYNCGPITKANQRPKQKVPIRADGNCLFNALAYVLTANQAGHMVVRTFLNTFIRANIEAFRGYSPDYHESIEIHLDYMAESAENAGDKDRWGTSLELYAFATVLNTTVWLFAPYAGSPCKWLRFNPLPLKSDCPPTDMCVFMSNESEHFEVVLEV